MVLHSESIATIAKALSAFQGKIQSIDKTENNPFYRSKYADLHSLWEEIRKPLTEQCLSVSQVFDTDESNTYLVTILLHGSGEWIAGRMRLDPVKNDPQGYGSAATYARRYGLAAILGLSTKGEDDDGNEASGKTNAVKKSPQPAPYRKPITQWQPKASSSVTPPPPIQVEE